MKKKNKYAILELIYEGMVARCYKARDPILNRLVLLKILNPNLTSDTQWIKRFEREAVIQAKLKHPNIVTIYELGKGDDFYIASEYIHGMTLKEMIEKKGPLELKLLSSIIKQIVSALRYAHKKGVIHRDLKPGNILITEKNEVKLADFGLAFALDSDSITQEGFVLGTPAYMSPEQARGKKVDYRSDIFSLGVTLYEALSGINPFKGNTYADSISKVLNSNPEPLTNIAPNIPVQVSDIVSKMLVKDRKKRLSKIDELEAIFEPFAGAVGLKKRHKKFSLIYALLSIPILILCISIYNSLMSTHKKEEIIKSKENTVFSRPAAVDTINLARTTSPLTKKKSLPVYMKQKEEYVNVRLIVLQWAYVYIDGDYIGTTPLREEIKLKKGKHQIILKHPYFPTFTEDVVITDSCLLTYDLGKKCAFLDIQVNPWGIVYIDGECVDTTPIARPIPVTLGEHLIMVKHTTLGERMEKVTIDSTKVYQFSYNLKSE